MVNSQYRGNRIKLDEACAHCAERIHLEANNGIVTQVTPEETLLCTGAAFEARNNLFRSEEHLVAWSAPEPLHPRSWILAKEDVQAIMGRYS